MQHINYAKTKSYATLRKEDPNFVPPKSANASALVSQGIEKRQRDDEPGEGERAAKRDKADEDEEEMEIDDEEDSAPQQLISLCTSRNLIISLYFTFVPPTSWSHVTPRNSGSVNAPAVYWPS